MKKILNNNFDLTGNESLRVSRMYLLSRLVPLGNFGTGPDVRCLLVFTALHYFSRPFFWLIVRRERQCRRLFRLLKRALGR